MCARIGMVTGEGLAGVLRRKFPVWLVVAFSVALLLANSLNIGADLSGMADAGKLMTGLNSQLLVCLFGVAISIATVVCRYRQIANTLQWLALSLFAYVVAALVMKADWSGVLHDTFVPSLPHGKRRLGHARRDPRHHHQPLSLLLAGLPGNRRGKSHGPRHHRAAARRHPVARSCPASWMSAWAPSSRIS